MKINAPGGNAAQVADRGRSGSFTLRESVCQSGNKGKCQNVRDRVATFITKLGGSLMQNFSACLNEPRNRQSKRRN